MIKNTYISHHISETHPLSTRLFHDEIARKGKLRLARSVLTLGSSKRPLYVLRVLLAETSERLCTRQAKAGGASSAISRQIRATSRSSNTLSKRNQPRASSAGVIRSRRALQVTIRAPKLIAFCIRFCWVHVHPPHTVVQ